MERELMLNEAWGFLPPLLVFFHNLFFPDSFLFSLRSPTEVAARRKEEEQQSCADGATQMLQRFFRLASLGCAYF